MRFKTGGKTYTAAALTRPTIRDYMKLEASSAAMGRRITSGDVFRIEAEIGALKTETERSQYPDLLLFLALVVWATMVESGEPDPWDRAVDTRLDDLDFIEDPQDHQESATPRKPRTTRKGSVRGAGNPAAKPAPILEATISSETSTVAS